MPSHVQERIVQNCMEPCFEVRTPFELFRESECLEIGFLHQVLGVGRIPGQPHRRAIQAVDVLHRVVVQGSSHERDHQG